ncbi:M81 family metallopeptidase [Tropicimonas sp. TH_r6]|uniref:M81 family metallopeptidase n=1 Tax=Tropicimonas sp. TH_r6 TaxID=3082085 RepID=UPI002952ADEF|nr:M81 family metallopeptidase [Tropicimonas sp. TH_r6]MDV7141453.1 M81 family metallopeptidase [Tropicimonas sp. TH_r6]
MRIAIGGLHTECSTYNPLLQERSDFRRLEGEALIAKANFDFAAAGIQTLPLFHEASVPGGPVRSEVFEAQCAELLDRLRAAAPLDGVLLLMHGAMFVPGIDDPEGDFITSVREVVGPDCLIAGSFDLHGQITARIAETLDIFAAFRTAPHVDVAETNARAAAMLARALKGAARPCVVRVPVPVLVSGEMSSTFVSPCDRLYAALPEVDARPGIWDANLMIGYVWADSPRATAAAVVTCEDAQAGQAAALEIAKGYFDSRTDLLFDMEALPLVDAVAALDGPAVLADSGDNPTGGGVGDRADVLQAVLAADRPALFAGIAAPRAYEALQRGATEIELGGELGGGGPRLTLSIESCRFAEGCAIVTTGPATVVISHRRRPFHWFADFAALGLSLDDHPFLVVKSGYLSADIRTLPRRQIMALTDGAVSQDLARLENLHRPRPSHPFQAL